MPNHVNSNSAGPNPGQPRSRVLLERFIVEGSEWVLHGDGHGGGSLTGPDAGTCALAIRGDHLAEDVILPPAVFCQASQTWERAFGRFLWPRQPSLAERLTEIRAMAPTMRDLEPVITAWPKLSERAKASILAMAATANAVSEPANGGCPAEAEREAAERAPAAGPQAAPGMKAGIPPWVR